MASTDRTFFLNDVTFHEDSWDAAVTNNNNDVTFHDQNGGGGGGGMTPAAAMAAAAPPMNNNNPIDLTFFDDVKPGTSYLPDAPTASLMTPNDIEANTPMPRTPMPTPQSAKRKIFHGEGAHTKRIRCDDSMNTSTDIDAMIRYKRIEMERAEAVRQEKRLTLVNLIPIVCDGGGGRYPDPVKFAALDSLAEMLAGHTDLVEDLVRNKPNVLKHMDEIAFRHADKEKVFTAVFRILSIMAENCFKLLLSTGDNDKHVKSLFKRFIKSDYSDVSMNAKLLVEKCKTQM